MPQFVIVICVLLFIVATVVLPNPIKDWFIDLMQEDQFVTDSSVTKLKPNFVIQFKLDYNDNANINVLTKHKDVQAVMWHGKSDHIMNSILHKAVYDSSDCGRYMDSFERFNYVKDMRVQIIIDSELANYLHKNIDNFNLTDYEQYFYDDFEKERKGFMSRNFGE